MIQDDPIMSELGQIREEILAECGGDADALFRLIKSVEAEEARKGRKIVSLSPRREDPRTAELARTRAEILADFGDFGAYLDHVELIEAEHRKLGLRYGIPSAHAEPAGARPARR